MNKMNKQIDESLGMQPIEEFHEVEIMDDKPKTPHVVGGDDYEFARSNFYNVIEKGTIALEEMMQVAKAGESPRAYEVISTLMKTLVEANKDLVSMGIQNNKDTDKDNTDDKVVKNQTAIFVGSTSELQKLLKNMKE